MKWGCGGGVGWGWGSGGYYFVEDFNTDGELSHNLAPRVLQVAFCKQFPLFLSLLHSTDVFFSSSVFFKQTCLFNVSQPLIYPTLPSPLFFPSIIIIIYVQKLSLGIFKKWTGQSSGHSPAEVQRGQHMEAISGPNAQQSKVGCSPSSEPLKNRLAALTCERHLGPRWCIDSLSLCPKHTIPQ